MEIECVRPARRGPGHAPMAFSVPAYKVERGSPRERWHPRSLLRPQVQDGDSRRHRRSASAATRSTSAIAAPDGEAAADNANGAEDKSDEHDDAHRFARAFGKAARSLGEDRREAHGNEKWWNVHADVLANAPRTGAPVRAQDSGGEFLGFRPIR